MTGAEGANAERAGRRPRDATDLVVIEPVDVMQDEGFAVVERKLPDGEPEAIMEFPAHDPRKDAVPLAFGVGGRREYLRGRRLRASATGTQVIATEIQSEPAQPRPE